MTLVNSVTRASKGAQRLICEDLDVVLVLWWLLKRLQVKLGDLVVTGLHKRILRHPGTLLPSWKEAWRLDLVLLKYLICGRDSLGLSGIHEGVLELIGEGASLKVAGQPREHGGLKLCGILGCLIPYHLAFGIFNLFLPILSEVPASCVYFEVFSFIEEGPALRFNRAMAVLTLSWLILVESHLWIELPVTLIEWWSCPARSWLRKCVIGGRCLRIFLLLLFSRYKNASEPLRAMLLGTGLPCSFIFSSFATSRQWLITQVNVWLWQSVTLLLRVPWHAEWFRHLLMLSHCCTKMWLHGRLDVLDHWIWRRSIYKPQIVFWACQGMRLTFSYWARR